MNIYFFTIAISSELKNYKHNADKNFYNLFQGSRNLLVKFYHKIKQRTPPYVLCLNFSIKTKTKTLFLISYFNLSKKRRNGTLVTRIASYLY